MQWMDASKALHSLVEGPYALCMIKRGSDTVAVAASNTPDFGQGRVLFSQNFPGTAPKGCAELSCRTGCMDL